MAEASANIRLTLDGQQAMQTADRLKSKIAGVSAESGLLARNLEQGAGILAKQLIGVMAIVAGLRQAVTAASDLNKEQGAAYKKGEEAARSVAIAERRAGLQPGFVNRIQGRDAAGAAVTSDIAARIIDSAREAGIKSPQEIERALLAAGSGYFADDEIIDKKRRRVIRQSEIDKRFTSMEASGFRAARIARQEDTAAEMDFAAGGGREAAISREAEAYRRSGTLPAIRSALQPEFLNRLDAGGRLSQGERDKRDIPFYEKTIYDFWSDLSGSSKRPIKVEAVNSKPQVGVRENAP